MAADGHLGMTVLSRVTLMSAGLSCNVSRTRSAFFICEVAAVTLMVKIRQMAPLYKIKLLNLK